MKSQWTRFLTAMGIVFLAAATAIAAPPVVELGYIEFPPVFSTNAQGKPEGSLIDLADMVLTKAGYEWHATSFPTKRMAKELVDGTIHLWIGLSTLPPFKDTTLIGKDKVLVISMRAFQIGNKPEIKKKEDLSEKSVLIMRGFSYGGWIRYIRDEANHVNFIETDSHETGFKMLKAGRADYFLDYMGPAGKVLKNMSIPDLRSSELSSFGAYFVVSKKAPNAENLLKTMEKAYDDLVREGKWTPPE